MAKLPDFESLTIQELYDLINAAQAAFDAKVAEKRAALQDELDKLANLFAVPTAPKPKPAGEKRGAVAPKYRSLKNPELVWGGRGQKAKWLVEEMKETGKPLEAFRIKE